MTEERTSPATAREEDAIFAELRELCGSPGYIHAIAYLCWRDNTIKYEGNSLKADDLSHQHSNERLLNTEISTLVGLMAKGNVSTIIPPPVTIQHFIDESDALLQEMHMALQKPWLSAFQPSAFDPSKISMVDPFTMPGAMREPIFYAGESAYNFQYKEFAKRKYAADDAWIVDKKGFSILEACELAAAISRLCLRKFGDLSNVLTIGAPEEWTLLGCFEFSPSELAKEANIDVRTAIAFIAAFTYDVAGKNHSFEGLNDFNELNAAPILKLDNDKFVVFQHYTLIEAVYESPFFWMANDKGYRSLAAKHRGDFAESILHDFMSRIFQDSHVHKNIDIYQGKDRIGEIDVLVLFGAYAIVIQAKSKRLTIESRKGNDLQLKDDFKKAIASSYDQAIICSKALVSGNCTFVNKDRESLKINSRITSIFPLCIVTDHYPGLSAQVWQYLKIEKSAVITAPIISDVFFVDVLSELLRSPLHLLNYLTLRAKFQAQIIVSHELPVLGFHLRHNLWFDKEYDMVNLGDEFTTPLDVAMLARRAGLPGERIPRGILTRFDGTSIGVLLKQIEAAATPQLVGLGMLLLQLSSESAKHVNNGIDKIVRLGARDGRNHDFSIPSEVSSSGFTVHANTDLDGVAMERLKMHCELRKYATKAASWFGILLSAGELRVRGALGVIGEWKPDDAMERALSLMPKRDPVPLASLSLASRERKVGRNDRCPCGSGKKFKHCCLAH